MHIKANKPEDPNDRAQKSRNKKDLELNWGKKKLQILWKKHVFLLPQLGGPEGKIMYSITEKKSEEN